MWCSSRKDLKCFFFQFRNRYVWNHREISLYCMLSECKWGRTDISNWTFHTQSNAVRSVEKVFFGSFFSVNFWIWEACNTKQIMINAFCESTPKSIMRRHAQIKCRRLAWGCRWKMDFAVEAYCHRRSLIMARTFSGWSGKTFLNATRLSQVVSLGPRAIGT